MTNKKIGRRGVRATGQPGVLSDVGETEEPVAARIQRVKTDGLEYTGPMDDGGFRLPAFSLTWGKAIGFLGTVVVAVIAATVAVLTFMHGIEDSIAKVSDSVAVSGSDIRLLQQDGTRNEERVRQLQDAVGDIRNQIAEHRRVSELATVPSPAPQKRAN